VKSAQQRHHEDLFSAGIYPSIDQLFVSSFCQKEEEEEGRESVKDKRGKGNDDKRYLGKDAGK
jgi:hypothetical protein